MSNKISTDELKRFLEERAKEFGNSVPNPAKAIAEQAATLRAFQEQVTKQIGETRSLMDSAKAFLKDPAGEGKKIVKDGLKAADDFFAKIFKTLGTDVGKIFKDSLGKITSGFDKLLKGAVTNLSKALERVGRALEKSTNKIAQGLSRELGKIVTNLNRALSNWGKSSGLIKAIGDIGKMVSSLKDQSKALAAFKDLGRSAGTILAVIKTFAKFLPLIGTLFDLKFRNDVTNALKDIQRAIKLNENIQDKQFKALASRISQVESTIKNGNGTQKLSAEVAAVKSAVQGLGPKIDTGFSGINRGLAPIPQILSKVGVTKDYSGQLSQIQSSLSQLNAKPTINYQQITSATTAALSAWKPGINIPTDLARKSDLSPLANKADLVKPEAINYGKINEGVTSALKAAELRIPDDVARKSDLNVLVKRSDMEALTKVQNDLNRIDYTKVSSSVRDALTNYKPKIELPPEVARRSDIDEIKRIPNLITDLNPVLSQLSSLGNQISKVDAKIAPPNLNPLQAQINSLQSAIANNINAGTNTVTSVVTNMGNTLQSFITNNNTTIVNQISRGIDLNPASIIDPLKQHINTQVAQPLSKTMEVLNVNDLARGVSMSAEAVIKASGMQQYGQGTGTATNLIGLTAMIAAPIFMRAGFHQLGNQFPADMRNPQGAKVTPTTALSMSQWQFNQVTNLVGMPTKMMVKEASGSVSQRSFQNQSDAIENIHAQSLGIEQDLSAIEKMLFKIMQMHEATYNIAIQNKYDLDVVIDELGPKTKQKIIKKPSVVTHGKNEQGTSFFDRLMSIADNFTVVRSWADEIDAKQLAQKTNMEAQIAALTNKWEFDKTNPQLPIVDRPDNQKPKKQNEDEWRRYVNTSENPDQIRQAPGLPIPEIKEINLGTTKEIPKPETNPEKLLGS